MLPPTATGKKKTARVTSGNFDDPPVEEKEFNDSLLPPPAKSKRSEPDRLKQGTEPRKKKKSGSEPAGGPDALLPQKARTGTEALLPETVGKDPAESILPPAAKAPPAEQVEPEVEETVSVGEGQIAESEKVLLPDGQGGFIEVSERTTRVEYRGTKVELVSMKREEKEASRTLRNFIVMVICVGILVGMILLLSWLAGS